MPTRRTMTDPSRAKSDLHLALRVLAVSGKAEVTRYTSRACRGAAAEMKLLVSCLRREGSTHPLAPYLRSHRLRYRTDYDYALTRWVLTLTTSSLAEKMLEAFQNPVDTPPPSR